MSEKPKTGKEYGFLLKIIENLPIGVVGFDMKGKIKFFNQRAGQLLNFEKDAEKFTNSSILDQIKDFSILYKKINNILVKNCNSFNIECIRYRNKYLTIRGRLAMDTTILTINDISKQKAIESQSIYFMLEGQEIERNRLAKEIHDGLGPLLSTIKINLEAINIEIEKQLTNEIVKNRLSSVYTLIDSLANDMRNISHSLMPKVLEDFGIGPALESLCNNLAGSNNMEIHYYDSGFEDRLDKYLELNIYRIAQELLNNAIKHSRASRINIQYIRHPKSIVLMVEDNGHGITDGKQSNTANTGIGLKNISTRTKMIGGTFFIDSNEGVGVTATLEVPLKQ
jgi:signal transduction histidine kinase